MLVNVFLASSDLTETPCRCSMAQSVACRPYSPTRDLRTCHLTIPFLSRISAYHDCLIGQPNLEAISTKRTLGSNMQANAGGNLSIISPFHVAAWRVAHERCKVDITIS
jgi:hypothetical protein